MEEAAGLEINFENIEGEFLIPSSNFFSVFHDFDQMLFLLMLLYLIIN